MPSLVSHNSVLTLQRTIFMQRNTSFDISKEHHIFACAMMVSPTQDFMVTQTLIGQKTEMTGNPLAHTLSYSQMPPSPGLLENNMSSPSPLQKLSTSPFPKPQRKPLGIIPSSMKSPFPSTNPSPSMGTTKDLLT